MSIKLTYLDFGGRALAARLALTIGGVPFEDERVTQFTDDDSWRSPTGGVPFLTLTPAAPTDPQPPRFTIDKPRVICQSHAINEFCATVAGFGSTNAVDALMIHQAIMQIEDISSGPHGFHTTMFIDNPAAKKTLREAFLNKNLIPNFKRLEQLLEESGTGYFGERLSVADLTWIGTYRHFHSGDVDHVPVSVIEGFPKLKHLAEVTVGAMPAVVAHFEAHPYG